MLRPIFKEYSHNQYNSRIIELTRDDLVEFKKNIFIIMDYITLIKKEGVGKWEIGYNKTKNLEEHKKFKKDMLNCVDVLDVKILKTEEINKDFLRASLQPQYLISCDKCSNVGKVKYFGEEVSLERFIQLGWTSSDKGDVFCPECSVTIND